MTARSIFLVRHAPTAANATRRFMGQQDVPAQEVEDPGRFAVPPIGPRIIYTSPLMRARCSVPVLFPDEEAVVDDRLVERSVGEWEGLDHATVRSRWPQAFAHGAINPSFHPPGGESMRQLQDRVADFLRMLASRTDDVPVYVVTHNGWIRTAMLINGDVSKAELFTETVPFLQPIAFDLRSERLESSLPFSLGEP